MKMTPHPLWRQRQHAAAAAMCSWQPSGTMHPEAGHCIGACVQQCSDINIFLSNIHTRYTHTIIWFNSFILYCILHYHQRSIHHFMKYAVLLACLFVSSSK